jgi:hypothetical protein
MVGPLADVAGPITISRAALRMSRSRKSLRRRSFHEVISDEASEHDVAGGLEELPEKLSGELSERMPGEVNEFIS